MPEAPEVKTIVDQLDAALANHKLEAVHVLSGRYHRHGGPVGLNEYQTKLPLLIEHVHCKGKFIYFVLSDTVAEKRQRWTFIWNTLGMTGRWSREQGTHSRILFKTSNGDFFFDDVRNFGTMHLNKSYIQTEKKLNALGLDILSDDVSFEQFKSKVSKGKKSIAETLMNQAIASGVGNYIKCEALYLSEISPHRNTGSLTNDELERLLASLKHVMHSSYKAKGHSMSDYKDLDGKEGVFKFNLLVYNKSHDPKGNLVVRETTLDGRTTHWVPGVQK